MSDPGFNPDKELIELLNGSLPPPPLSHEEMAGLAEFMQEENMRLRKIIPVLDKHELIPRIIDTQPLDHINLTNYLRSGDQELKKFALRTSILAIALEAADDYGRRGPSEHTRAIATEQIRDEVGKILEDNKSAGTWLIAAHEVLGDMLPIPNEESLLDLEVSQLIERWQSREIELQNQHPSVFKIRGQITQEIVRKFGEHDDVDAIVRRIIETAISQYTLDEEMAMSAEELHEEIMTDRTIKIDPLTLEGLVYTVKKAIRREA